MSDTPLPEPLEDFLQHPPSLPVNAALKESLLQRTRPMRKPRWWRWPAVAAAAAGIVLALVSAYFGFRAGPLEPAPKEDLVERKQAPPAENPQPQPPVVPTPLPPRELERTAFDAPDDQQRARLFFRAGDLYLDEHQDYESAARCYQQALPYCDERELEFNPNDNWLLLSLKGDYHLGLKGDYHLGLKGD